MVVEKGLIPSERSRPECGDAGSSRFQPLMYHGIHSFTSYLTAWGTLICSYSDDGFLGVQGQSFFRVEQRRRDMHVADESTVD